MGRERVLLSDVDGVLAYTAEPVIREVNKMCGIVLRVEDIDDWNYVNREVTRRTGSKRLGEEASKLWYDPDILAQAEPIKGAVEAIKYLVNVMGWRVWTATARLPNAQQMTIDWVYGNFPEIERSGGVYMRQSGMEEFISEHVIKLAAAGMLDPDVCVEDNPKTVKILAENLPRKIKPRILMPNRGWNRNAGREFDEFRVEEWEEILAIAKKM